MTLFCKVYFFIRDHSDSCHVYLLSVSLSGFSLIRSSIRNIEMAASVAKRSDLIFEIAGSTTPASKLSTGRSGERKKMIMANYDERDIHNEVRDYL